MSYNHIALWLIVIVLGVALMLGNDDDGPTPRYT